MRYCPPFSSPCFPLPFPVRSHTHTDAMQRVRGPAVPLPTAPATLRHSSPEPLYAPVFSSLTLFFCLMFFAPRALYLSLSLVYVRIGVLS